MVWLEQLVSLLTAGEAVGILMPPKGPGSKEKGVQNTNNKADAKILCDEAAGHLKTGKYTKALNGYNLVGTH
jgi:hypothetical protein